MVILLCVRCVIRVVGICEVLVNGLLNIVGNVGIIVNVLVLLMYSLVWLYCRWVVSVLVSGVLLWWDFLKLMLKLWIGVGDCVCISVVIIDELVLLDRNMFIGMLVIMCSVMVLCRIVFSCFLVFLLLLMNGVVSVCCMCLCVFQNGCCIWLG